MFKEIWEKQKSLMAKFDMIEQSHNLLQIPMGMPVDLDSKYYQARIRDLSQRVIGEVAEATEALSFKSFSDFEEEMADVYHFLIELMILSDIPQTEVFFKNTQDLPELFLDVEADLDETFVQGYVAPSPEAIREAAYGFVETLCLAVNELKKKPWKANHDGRDTNIKKYYLLLAEAHYDFLGMCYLSGITANDLYNSYLEKHEINEQRIASA